MDLLTDEELERLAARDGPESLAARALADLRAQRAELWPEVGDGMNRYARRREANAAGIVSCHRPVAHARLAHADRANAGHHLALGQVAVAHDPTATVGGLEISVLAEKIGDLGLHGLGQQDPCPIVSLFSKQEFVARGVGKGVENAAASCDALHGCDILRPRA
jgi:hypothetical protein